MKKIVFIISLFLSCTVMAQETTYGNNGRIQRIANNLEALSIDNSGLTENLKLNINVSTVSLSNFLLAIAEVHNINITVDPSLNNINMVNNFSNVTIADLLVFLCKQYGLDIAFTGNILSIRPYVAPVQKVPEKEIGVSYDAINDLITIDVNQDALGRVFRKIIDETGQNLLYGSGMENIPLTIYIKDAPIASALGKLADVSGLSYSKSRDGFYLFEQTIRNGNENFNGRGRNSSLNYQVIDTVARLLNVDFQNVPIEAVVQQISMDLDLDVYTATPLSEAGTVSIKAKQIYYDELLKQVFESRAKVSERPPDINTGRNTTRNTISNQNTGTTTTNGGTSFTFKKENDMYFFGTSDQLSVRKLEVVQMMHRSVELLGDPVQGGNYGRSAGRTVGGNVNYLGNGFSGNNGFGNVQNNFSQNNNTLRRANERSSSFGEHGSKAEAIVNILPDEVVQGLDIKIDFELNSFLISGPAANINRFKKFIGKIDKPVPVVLIEVMLIEVRNTSTLETGISWGIGDEPVSTGGALFPEADLTLGAKTVNRIIGGFDGFGSFNIGKVVPEFFATIRAMEQNGNIKIRSTPKLSTLNGHRANLSIGETTYYVVTSQNFFGSQIPTTSEIRNFLPIDAELAVSIKPLVSGNGQVTLDINVIQSDFSGERIDEDAPPGLTSREFSSIIRMQNQDLAILGGLEEKVKNDSGSGVPFLARIPIIKWLFSRRTRADSKQKLTILIKPTVIY